MTDSDDDAIAAWAQGLTPEGAPGEMAVMMRKILGDEGYEQALAQHDALSDLHLDRQRLINKILMLVVIYGAIVVPIVALAFAAVFIRNFF